MKKEIRISYFIPGNNRHRKANYLATVIKTQNGVFHSSYNKKNHLLTVSYDPEVMSPEYIEELSWSLGCKLISDKTEVEQLVRLCSMERFLKITLTIEALFLVLFMVYLYISLLCENDDSSFRELLPMSIFLLALGGTALWRNQIQNKIGEK